MLRRFFIPASDSMWRAYYCAQLHHRWHLLWNLVWVAWMFGDLVFVKPAPGGWWWPVTAVATVALLGLLACAHVRPHREVSRYALAIAALALLIMPVNQVGSGDCAIYACVYLAFQPNLRRMLALVVPVLFVWVLEALLLHWQWASIAWVAVIAFGIAMSVHFGWQGRLRNAELRLSMDEVRRLAASAERERIGRDLHDLLGHTLSMVALKSELAGRLIERDPRAARKEIADVERVAREALSQVRSAVTGIRAAALVSEFASARLLLETAGVQMEYWADGNPLPSDAETCLALVLREAVTNVQRHARANRVEVTVIAGAERVVMRIRDDGRGGVNAYGNGLAGMRERIVARGGEIAIDSPRGQGTSIEVWLPIQPAPAQVERDAKKISSPGTVVPLAQRAGSRA